MASHLTSDDISQDSSSMDDDSELTDNDDDDDDDFEAHLRRVQEREVEVGPAVDCEKDIILKTHNQFSEGSNRTVEETLPIREVTSSDSSTFQAETLEQPVAYASEEYESVLKTHTQEHEQDEKGFVKSVKSHTHRVQKIGSGANTEKIPTDAFPTQTDCEGSTHDPIAAKTVVKEEPLSPIKNLAKRFFTFGESKDITKTAPDDQEEEGEFEKQVAALNKWDISVVADKSARDNKNTGIETDDLKPSIVAPIFTGSMGDDKSSYSNSNNIDKNDDIDEDLKEFMKNVKEKKKKSATREVVGTCSNRSPRRAARTKAESVESSPGLRHRTMNRSRKNVAKKVIGPKSRIHCNADSANERETAPLDTECDTRSSPLVNQQVQDDDELTFEIIDTSIDEPDFMLTVNKRKPALDPEGISSTEAMVDFGDDDEPWHLKSSLEEADEAQLSDNMEELSRSYDNDENFIVHNVPMIPIVVADHMKNVLLDDDIIDAESIEENGSIVLNASLNNDEGSLVVDTLQNFQSRNTPFTPIVIADHATKSDPPVTNFALNSDMDQNESKSLSDSGSLSAITDDDFEKNQDSRAPPDSPLKKIAHFLGFGVSKEPLPAPELDNGEEEEEDDDDVGAEGQRTTSSIHNGVDDAVDDEVPAQNEDDLHDDVGSQADLLALSGTKNNINNNDQNDNYDNYDVEAHYSANSDHDSVYDALDLVGTLPPNTDLTDTDNAHEDHDNNDDNDETIYRGLSKTEHESESPKYQSEGTAKDIAQKSDRRRIGYIVLLIFLANVVAVVVYVWLTFLEGDQSGNGTVTISERDDIVWENPEFPPDDSRSSSLSPPNTSGCNGLENLCNVRVNEMLFAVVHNAASTEADGFGTWANHKLPLEQALEAGYRGIDLDIGKCDDGSLQFVHGRCSFAKRDPITVLTNIVKFMEDNPKEVIIMHTQIVDGASSAGEVLMEEIGELFIKVPGLMKLLYQAPDPGVLWPTLQDLIDINRRIIFFHMDGQDCDASGVTCHPTFNEYFDYAVETNFDFDSIEALKDRRVSCGLREPGLEGEKDFFAVNAFATVPGYEFCSLVNEESFLEEHLTACAQINTMQPNLLLVDCWDQGAVLQIVQKHNAAILPSWSVNSDVNLQFDGLNTQILEENLSNFVDICGQFFDDMLDSVFVEIKCQVMTQDVTTVFGMQVLQALVRVFGESTDASSNLERSSLDAVINTSANEFRERLWNDLSSYFTSITSIGLVASTTLPTTSISTAMPSGGAVIDLPLPLQSASTMSPTSEQTMAVVTLDLQL